MKFALLSMQALSFALAQVTENPLDAASGTVRIQFWITPNSFSAIMITLFFFWMIYLGMAALNNIQTPAY